MTIDTSKTYLATVKTDVGHFRDTLDAKESPVAVNSFVFLADHKFYNCVIFHRVIPGSSSRVATRPGQATGDPGTRSPKRTSGRYPAAVPARVRRDGELERPGRTTRLRTEASSSS